MQTTYDHPDQVNSVISVPGGFVNAATTVVRTYNESREAIAAHFRVEGKFKLFGFSLSQSLRKMQESIFKESSYVSTVSAFESAQQAQLQAYYDLYISDEAQQFIDNYLSDADSDSDFYLYRTFISTFGTHYFKTANYGGLLLMELETKTQYYREHGELELKVQAEASFSSILKSSAGVEISKSSVNEEFKKMTKTNVR